MTPLPTPPEVEAWETHRRAVVRYWPNRREKCPPHDQLDVRLDLADSALAARTRQAEELTAENECLRAMMEQAAGVPGPGKVLEWVADCGSCGRRGTTCVVAGHDPDCEDWTPRG